jgi:thiol:disulfide interchange protein DsbC
MKKITLLLITVLATMLMAGNDLTKVQLDQIKKQNRVLQNPTLHIKVGQDLQTVYFLKIEARGPNGTSKIIEAFLDKKTGALYIGNGYDKSGKEFSFPLDIKAVDEAVAFTYGTGKKELYLVSDPECPYCTKFAKESEGKLQKYTVHVILYPLSFHKNAKVMTNYIITGKDDMEKTKRYQEIVLNRSTVYKKTKVDSKTLNAYLLKSNAAAYELGARGTPTFFVKEGNTFRQATWKEVLQK